MSKDKHKSKTRQFELLEWASYVSPYYKKAFGIPIHSEGGIGLTNPDLQRLIKSGHLKIVRFSLGYSRRLSPKRFVGDFQRDYCIDPKTERGMGIHGHVNRTRAVITDKGLEAIKRGSL